MSRGGLRDVIATCEIFLNSNFLILLKKKVHESLD